MRMLLGLEDADRVIEALTAPMRDLLLEPEPDDPSPNLTEQMKELGLVTVGGSGRWHLTAFGQLVQRRLKTTTEEE